MNIVKDSERFFLLFLASFLTLAPGLVKGDEDDIGDGIGTAFIVIIVVGVLLLIAPCIIFGLCFCFCRKTMNKRMQGFRKNKKTKQFEMGPAMAPPPGTYPVQPQQSIVVQPQQHVNPYTPPEPQAQFQPGPGSSHLSFPQPQPTPMSMPAPQSDPQSFYPPSYGEALGHRALSEDEYQTEGQSPLPQEKTSKSNFQHPPQEPSAPNF